MDSMVRWMTLCLLGALAATCGQTGPLTLPEEPQVQRQEQTWSHTTHLIQ